MEVHHCRDVAVAVAVASLQMRLRLPETIIREAICYLVELLKSPV